MKTATNNASGREKRIISLAKKIDVIMREHEDRLEAIDAYDMARILFRKGTEDGGITRRPSLSLPLHC